MILQYRLLFNEAKRNSGKAGTQAMQRFPYAKVGGGGGGGGGHGLRENCLGSTMRLCSICFLGLETEDFST